MNTTDYESIWKASLIHVTDEFSLPPVVLQAGEAIIGTLGNFSVSTGKAKAKKTFNVSAIVAAALINGKVLEYRASFPDSKRNVLYFDTEQSPYHCQLVLQRILKLAGLPMDEEPQNLVFSHLRPVADPNVRREIIRYAIYNTPNVGLVVIDGIRDLMLDINNSTEATRLVGDLMQWTSEQNIHIQTVLHLNKGDDNARGHIGTELNNKAETVLQITKDNTMPERSIVAPAIIRSKPFEKFAFRLTEVEDEVCIPQIDFSYSDNERKQHRIFYQELSDNEHQKALVQAFSANEILSYGELIIALKRLMRRLSDNLTGKPNSRNSCNFCSTRVCWSKRSEESIDSIKMNDSKTFGRSDAGYIYLNQSDQRKTSLVGRKGVPIVYDRPTKQSPSSTKRKRLTVIHFNHQNNITMDIKQIKQISITDYLQQQGYKPAYIKGFHYWYCSPLRKESTPSFKVNTERNQWYDFGTGEHGDIIDLASALHRCSISQAIKDLRDSKQVAHVDFSFGGARKFSERRLNFLSAQPLSSPHLLRYLAEREIPLSVASAHCSEVRYQNDSREFYAIGFANDAGGWEIRSPYFKGCIAPKAITTLNRGIDHLQIFEGFMDFLSWQTLNPSLQSDALVLNSLALLPRIKEQVKDYKQVESFLDNDDAGRKSFEVLKQFCPHVIDGSTSYRAYKDINEWLVAQSKIKEKQPLLLIAKRGIRK